MLLVRNFRFLPHEFRILKQRNFNPRYMSSNIKETLLSKVVDPVCTSGNKITICGAGQVGMACAMSILTQNISNEICLIDKFKDKVLGEKLDLQHGSAFLQNAVINAGTDYALTAGSRICVVTAGVRQNEGESRLALIQRNTDVFKDIIPELIRYSPNTILLIVSNPVDILTYVAWKLSGLSENRVIGSGTNLDSSRFRFLLSQCLGLAPTSCHGWIIGEHGDSSVPVWSEVNIAGVRLKDIMATLGTEEDTDGLKEIHTKVIDSAYKIINLKGYTSWAIGLSVGALCQAILRNSMSVHALSTYVRGQHGIDKEVFLSLPCVLGTNGITHIVRQHLSPDEVDQLHNSAHLIHSIQVGINL